MLLVAVAISAAWPGLTCAQVIEALDIEPPRDFGYVIGDTISQRISVRLQAGFELDPESLPDAGRVNLWLELDEPVLNRSGQQWTLVLSYRLINRVETSVAVFVPQLELDALGDRRSVGIVVPGWGITQNPVVPPALLQTPIRALDVRADRPPPAVDAASLRLRLIVLASLATIAGLVLVWQYLVAPRLRRKPQPFGHALRELRALRGTAKDWTGAEEASALRLFHRALNETAGRALFITDLDGFVERRPDFAPLRPRIDAFFLRSSAVFFGDRAGADAWSAKQLISLAHDCRAIERRR